MARWLFSNWHWFNSLIAAAGGVRLALNWGTMPTIQWLMLAQMLIINLHFVEEFAMPGGFPLIANAVGKKSDVPDRWPLNQWNAAAGNNWFLVLVYLPAFIWPDVTWLTLGVPLFGLLEVLAHGVVFTAILKRPDNPGNRLSMAVVNTIAWLVCAAAIAFPGAIWLGLATMFFGFCQVLGHGIQMNPKTKG